MSFNTVNYLIFEKRRPELDNELLEGFSAFLTMKSFSFLQSGKYVDYINNTMNVYGNIFDNKEDQFKFFENIIPKQHNRRRIDYIKKSKIKKEENAIIPEFYSKREIENLEDLNNYFYE